jgi:hypothetical protein
VENPELTYEQHLARLELAIRAVPRQRGVRFEPPEAGGWHPFMTKQPLTLNRCGYKLVILTSRMLERIDIVKMVPTGGIVETSPVSVLQSVA